MSNRNILVVGAVLAGLAVVLGAFGAHWLEGAVKQWGLEPADELKRMTTWETAVRYQMYHALALLVLGRLAGNANANYAAWSARLFVAGTVIFSGCLYALVLSGVKVLGAIVPIGGTCMIVGWALLAIVAWKSRE
ncbi:MAG: DUF423 domain-containing protein [Planctomycetaceae bacterium]|nr:DUF423 domain-containing protein [Planctomycetales bacterium]MCB9926947.1 DUF423 domain-containing protein [Planctomycetaceae bacterium]